MFRFLRARLAQLRELFSEPAAWSNLLTVCGALLISGGAYWIYRPAGPIVAGLAAIAIAVLMHSDDDPRYE